MSKMPITRLQRTTARLASTRLARDSHTPVERAVSRNGTVIVEVEQFAIRNFDDGLADDVLTRPAQKSIKMSALTQEATRIGRNLQHAEFDLLDDLGSPVDDLGLPQVIYLDSVRSLHLERITGLSWYGI